jgi:hypothetical protein
MAQAMAATTATVEPDLSAGLDDVVPAFKALVSLAHSLVSNDTWWQEAKVNYPLLLIEALYKTGEVSYAALTLPHPLRRHPSRRCSMWLRPNTPATAAMSACAVDEDVC